MEPTTTATTYPGPTVQPEANLRSKLAKMWAYLRFADSASAMERINRQGNLVRRLVRKRQDGTLGQATATLEDEEDMTVSIGDQNHAHYYGPPQQPKPSQTSLLKQAAIGVALLAGGAALPYVAPKIGAVLSGGSHATSQTPAPTPHINWNDYELGISSGTPQGGNGERPKTQPDTRGSQSRE